MNRNKYIRLFVLLLAVSLTLGLFSYVRGRSSQTDDNNTNCDGSKCPGSKTKTEVILFESLTRNLLVSNR
jgi:hypothetical protein